MSCAQGLVSFNGDSCAGLRPSAYELPEPEPVSHFELAEHWAPVWYHDTDDTHYEADYIVAYDFDGDTISSNNWENLDEAFVDLSAVIYYAVIETTTHYASTTSISTLEIGPRTATLCSGSWSPATRTIWRGLCSPFERTGAPSVSLRCSTPRLITSSTWRPTTRTSRRRRPPTSRTSRSPLRMDLTWSSTSSPRVTASALSITMETATASTRPRGHPGLSWRGWHRLSLR